MNFMKLWFNTCKYLFFKTSPIFKNSPRQLENDSFIENTHSKSFVNFWLVFLIICKRVLVGNLNNFLGERSETLQLALVIVHGLCIPRPHSSILFLRINALLAIPMCARTHKTFEFQFCKSSLFKTPQFCMWPFNVFFLVVVILFNLRFLL